MLENENKRKKIVQFVHGLTSGGAETLVKDYAIELKKRGYDVIVMVLTSFPDMPNEKALRKEGVPIYVVSPKRNSIIKRAFNKFYGEKFIEKKVHDVIKKENPDIVHIHLHLVHYLDFSKNLLKTTKLFYTCHSIPSVIFSEQNKTYKKNLKSIKRFHNMDNLKIIGLHSKMKKEIDELLGYYDTIVLNNPINVARFQNTKLNTDNLRYNLGIPEDAYVIGHVGRFSPVKNHKCLLRIFDACLKKNNKAFLLLVGDGPMLNDIKKEIDSYGFKEKVLILSNREDVPELMHIMDVFCMPSIYEGFPLVTLEAQASDLRCVVSEGIPDEAIVNNAVCRLSLTDSIDEWRDALLNEPFNYSKEEKKYLYRYDLSKVVDQLIYIYF